MFFGVLAVLVAGIVAGLCAGNGKPAAALYSNLVFRVQVGLVVALAAYFAVAALWLAWHQALFQRLTLGGAGLETPEQKEDVADRDAGIKLFMEETADTLLKLSDRLEDLEEGATGEKGSSG